MKLPTAPIPAVAIERKVLETIALLPGQPDALQRATARRIVLDELFGAVPAHKALVDRVPPYEPVDFEAAS